LRYKNRKKFIKYCKKKIQQHFSKLSSYCLLIGEKGGMAVSGHEYGRGEVLHLRLPLRLALVRVQSGGEASCRRW